MVARRYMDREANDNTSAGRWLAGGWLGALLSEWVSMNESTGNQARNLLANQLVAWWRLSRDEGVGWWHFELLWFGSAPAA